MDEETTIQRVEVSTALAVARNEIESQLDAAHKYPRSVKRFLAEAVSLATLTQGMAESCIYSMPREGKMIAGPSVRLAEICASAYGNLHVGARVVEEGEKTITAQGVVWDLEKNVKVQTETKRRITTKAGKRYSDDMIVTTGNAAASIALRNAVFRVIPKAYVDTIYEQCRSVAVGDARTLESRRADLFARLNKLGVTTERILERVGKASIEDVGAAEMELLIGIGTAIKSGGTTIEEAFPAKAEVPNTEGRRIKLGQAMREPGEEG